jgi:transposase
MSKCGTFFYKKQIRPFNSESFGEYIDELLGKFEEIGLENVVIIMENVRFHHSQEVLGNIVEKSHTYRFLPLHIPLF